MKIKSVKRLPDWLTPEKYAPLAEFDAREWLEQLRYRRHILLGNPIYPVIRDLADSGDELTSWVMRNSSKIDDLCNSPLARLGSMSAFIVAGRPSATILAVGDFTYPALGEAPLRSVTIGDLRDQARRDRSPKAQTTDKAERWEYLSQSHDSRRFPPGLEDQNLLLGDEGNPVLAVDITASDSDIQEFFSAWLSKARKAHNLKHVRRSEPKYEKWGAYGILPYLDVKIWSMRSGEKPTDKILAQFVAEFSGDVNVDAKRIGGVTAVIAKELMCERSELLSELESLAILEREVRKH